MNGAGSPGASSPNSTSRSPGPRPPAKPSATDCAALTKTSRDAPTSTPASPPGWPASRCHDPTSSCTASGPARWPTAPSEPADGLPRRSVSSAQQRYPERADFPACVAAADHRVFLHDLPRGLLVGSIEDDQAGIGRSQRRAGQDELAAGQQALQPLEMLGPDGLLLGCHRRGEVI